MMIDIDVEKITSQWDAETKKLWKDAAIKFRSQCSDEDWKKITDFLDKYVIVKRERTND